MLMKDAPPIEQPLEEKKGLLICPIPGTTLPCWYNLVSVEGGSAIDADPDTAMRKLAATARFFISNS
jgi:hypothetical protein